MLSAEIVTSIGAGLFMAIVTMHITLQAINVILPARQSMFVKPFVIPAVLYATALWKAPDMPYVAVTIAVIATIRFSIFAAIVIAVLAYAKWEEVLVEAVF